MKVVLSGMSTYAQVEDNLATFKDFKPLDQDEEKLVEKLKKSKIYLTYFNTWCMVITPYSCRQERRQHCE